MALSLGLIVGCQSEPSGARESAALAPEMATETAPEATAEVQPTFVDSAELPLSSMSAPQRGNPRVPFGVHDPNARAGLSSANVRDAVFPIHNTGGSLVIDSDLKIPRLEVQELADGRIRVWVRVHNEVNRELKISVTCAADQFEAGEEQKFYRDVSLPPEVYRDFSFIINGPINRRFTVLVQESIPGRASLR